MASMRPNPRLQVGSAAWITEERASALQIAEAEAEEFTFSARNEVDWLNEHMAEIFSKNQVNVAEIFKTPGKLRGKTPRTIRKANPLESRAPLSDVFSATPKGGPSPFRQTHFERPVSTFQVAEDEPQEVEEVDILPTPTVDEDPFIQKPGPNNFDSGYFGSQYATQQTQATQPNDPIDHSQTTKASPPKPELVQPAEEEDVVMISPETEERRSTEGSFQSAKEEQTRKFTVEVEAEPEVKKSPLKEATHPFLESPLQTRTQPPPSPQKRSPQRPPQASPPKSTMLVDAVPIVEDEPMEDVQSPSEGSSPLRPIVRKSSLNFASLPAREPITTKKSIGNRVSRTSHLEQPRTSYYGRQTGGKSLGNVRPDEQQDDDDMDLDEPEQKDPMSRLHNKTSTQRLQDQISMLGMSQSNNRPASKSIANIAAPPPPPAHAPHTTQAPAAAPPAKEAVHKSPQRHSPQRKPFVAPGAFPEDEDDSWIGPPNTEAAGPSIFSPRPQLIKSHSTDVMERTSGESIVREQFNIPKRGDEYRQRSPLREPAIPDRTTSTIGHTKSVSTSVLRSPRKAGGSPGKAISVSNPNPSIASNDRETTPPKSPSRSYKGSPLKAAKDKFSSILKTSRGLFASSAAVSAEAKTSALSPASSRMGLNSQRSFEEVLQGHKYPSQDDLSKSQHSQRVPDSPGKASVRKTRASTEKEERRKEDEARGAKEAKEAQKMNDQLEKARQKVKEEARVFHLEQERVATMQKEVIARKEQEKLAKSSQADISRATRSSPRKTKAQLEAEGIAAAAASTDELSSKDIEMSDASAMPPPSRPKSQIGRPPAKRPLKPAKDTVTKAKPPTVIRVDTGSQRGHVGHQYHPSNSTLAATLQESLSAPSQANSSQGQLRKQASTSSMQSTSSRTGFKSAASKALEAAARKKEQDELAAQRKKEAKQEVERQRAANKEEERRKEEQQRRQEAERQRALQREKEQAAAAADAKRSASRQALEKKRLEVEKAKTTAPPPPAARPHPNGADLTLSMLHDKPLPSVPSQRPDIAQSKAPHMSSRPQDETVRPANTALHTSAKVPPKRPLQQDVGDELHSRPTMQRNPPSYQHTDHHSKRQKKSDVFDDDDDMSPPPAKLTAPPIRQSSSRPRETQPKSIFPFPNGYTSAPPTTNLQKSTLISQHAMNQSKPAHPMDMTQVSKAPIPFASNQGNAQHKTPARPGAAHHGGKSAKSAAKSSPAYQNGENIVLPEIHTDSEDEDSDAGNDFPIAQWADSPVLRGRLLEQEGMNPTDIFGPPTTLDMEQVFSKSKDRFAQFRKRTSSANWSGQDALTNEEIRKDLEARDRIRRQGGWTHNTMA